MTKGVYHQRLSRVFIVIFLVISVVSIVAGITVFYKSQQKKYMDNEIEKIRSNADTLQLRFNIVRNHLTTVLNSNEAFSCGQSSTVAEFYKSFIEINTYIKKITSANPVVDYNIYPVVLADVPMLTNWKNYNGLYNFEKITGLEPNLIHQLTEKLNSGQSIDFITEDQNGRVLLYKAETYQYVKLPITYIVSIPLDSLGIHVKDNNGFLLLNDEQILYEENFTKLNTEDLFNKLRYQENNDTESFLLTYDDYYIYYLSQDNMGFQYAYVFSRYNSNFYVYIWIALLLFAIIFGLALVVSRIIVAKLYAPINDVIQVIPNKDKYDFRDEFGVIKSNTTVINQLNEQLNDIIEENKSVIQEKFYRDLLLGLDVRKREYSKLKMDKNKRYRVAMVKLLTNDDQMINEAFYILKNKIKLHIFKTDFMRYVNMNFDTFVILIGDKDLQESKIILENLVEQFEEDIIIKMALSNNVKGIKDISKAYEEASSIMEYKYLFDHLIVLTQEDIQSLIEGNLYYPLVLENKLIFEVVEGKDEALETFEYLVKENIINRNLAPATLQNLVFALFGTVNRILQELKMQPDDYLDQGFNYDLIIHDWDKPIMIKNLQTVLTEIIQRVKDKKSNLEEETTNKMIQYIHDNYSDNIMLVDLADNLGLSTQYCSILFKRLTGENFKNYLSNYRVERAKELLGQNPSIKISQLSIMVGFNSSNNFIRVFNKYTGVSPKVYANNLVEEKKI